MPYPRIAPAVDDVRQVCKRCGYLAPHAVFWRTQIGRYQVRFICRACKLEDDNALYARRKVILARAAKRGSRAATKEHAARLLAGRGGGKGGGEGEGRKGKRVLVPLENFLPPPPPSSPSREYGDGGQALHERQAKEWQGWKESAGVYSARGRKKGEKRSRPSRPSKSSSRKRGKPAP